jgi:hypothetical protein
MQQNDDARRRVQRLPTDAQLVVGTGRRIRQSGAIDVCNVTQP